MKQLEIEPLREAIAERTGLQIPASGAIVERLSERIRKLGLASADEYCRYVLSGGEKGLREWQLLLELVAVGESYFFRDKAQFALLREGLLPELVASRRSDRRLRIWSAGCSTGEEPYSVAIALAEILPNWKQWDLEIIGTDINHAALERAQQGCYTDWSLRGVSQKCRERYFQFQGGYWRLRQAYRDMVRFAVLNLVQEGDRPCRLGLQEVDLIICRNVFIYFARETIVRVIEGFRQILRPGGMLLTGHGELYGIKLERWSARMLPESIVFVNRPPPKSPVSLPEAPVIEIKPLSLVEAPPLAKVPLPEPAKPIPNALTEFKDCVQQGDDRGVIAAQSRLHARERNVETCLAIACAYARLGDLSRGVACCEEALSLDGDCVEGYFVLAMLQELQGDRASAKAIFKKTIYLFPDWIPAYLELGSLYLQDSNWSQGAKMFRVALSLLEKQLSEDGLAVYSLLDRETSLTGEGAIAYAKESLNRCLEKGRREAD